MVGDEGFNKTKIVPRVPDNGNDMLRNTKKLLVSHKWKKNQLLIQHFNFPGEDIDHLQCDHRSRKSHFSSYEQYSLQSNLKCHKECLPQSVLHYPLRWRRLES